jgi:glycosyltransferase involved in cell wall biosynthesis
MKILVFSPYYPPHIGGLETHADEFNKYLSQKNVDITVFTPQLPASAPESEMKHNTVKIIRFPAFEIVPNYPLPKFWSFKFWELFNSLFKQKFDIVISRTRFFSTSLLALVYAKIKKIKWIHIEHGSDFVQLSSKFKTSVAKLYDYTFGSIVFKFSDQNISISRAVQKFVYKFDKRESPVIYRGLDIDEIEKISPDLEFKKEQQDKLIIVWTGRLYKWKGVKNTIEAVKNLPEEIKKKVIFVIVGDGEDAKQLKEISDSSILIIGNKTRKEAISIVKVSDIYIHSSLPGGGLSTSLLEAMYCGCAVIATPNEGSDEVITDNETGILLENNSSKLLIEKIIALYESQTTRERLSNRAKERVKKTFNWDTAINSYMQHIKIIK